MTDEIMFEEVTILLPKRIMAFLRFRAGQQDIQVRKHIENCVLDQVRADLECMAGTELIGFLEFDRIFYELLGDKKYEPKATRL